MILVTTSVSIRAGKNLKFFRIFFRFFRFYGTYSSTW